MYNGRTHRAKRLPLLSSSVSLPVFWRTKRFPPFECLLRRGYGRKSSARGLRRRPRRFSLGTHPLLLFWFLRFLRCWRPFSLRRGAFCSSFRFRFQFLLRAIPLPETDIALDGRARTSVETARRGDDLILERLRREIERRKRQRGKRLTADAVDHEREIDLREPEVDEVFFHKTRLEHGFEHFRIERSHAERDGRADVAEDRVAHIFFHLFDVLMRDGEIELILARLREDVGKRVVGE